MRCFIAIELPQTIIISLGRIQEELKKCGADVRWVNPENIHLTLKFLGDVTEDKVNGIRETIEKVCSKHTSFNLTISGVGLFPGLKSPRVLWTGIEKNSALTALQYGIEEEMAIAGFKPEKRGFNAHLTIGRFRSSQGKERLLDTLAMHEKESFGVLEVSSLSFIKSELTPAGARYTKLTETWLTKSKEA